MLIIWATGTISKSLRQHLSNIPGEHENREVQTTLTVGSADVQVQNILNMGNNITCSTNCKYRAAVTLHAVETWFVFSVYNCKYCINMINNNNKCNLLLLLFPCYGAVCSSPVRHSAKHIAFPCESLHPADLPFTVQVCSAGSVGRTQFATLFCP